MKTSQSVLWAGKYGKFQKINWWIVAVCMCFNMHDRVLCVLTPLFLCCHCRTETKLVQLNTGTVTPSKCEDGVVIFNSVSSVQNPVTWGELDRFMEQGNIYPSLKFIWYYCLSLNKHRLIHKIYALFLHLLPAILVDTGAMIIGKQPR